MSARRQGGFIGNTGAISLPVRPFKQSRALCGPACLKMILAYFGHRVSEKSIAKLCRTSTVTGTTGANLVRAAHRLGLVARIVDRANFATIERWLARGAPVIVDWMSVLRAHGSRQQWACGHYSVVYGINKTHLWLQDPAIGRARTMSRRHFLNVWFDFKHIVPRVPDDLIIRRVIIAAPAEYLGPAREGSKRL
jgi:ABC-type bacteriocin/lantibiotic exporter with double-glycine peptidase domain